MSIPGNEEQQLQIWVKASQGGDVEAFEALFRTLHRRLLAYCSRVSGDSAAAEEVVQETFVRAWQSLSSFRFESQFYTWLRRIASRLLIDRLRLKSEKIWQETVEFEEAISESGHNLEEQLDLDRIIRRLPNGARSVFIMHDVEGLAHKEIAALLGIAEGTSKAQLARARLLLQQAWLS